MKRTSAISMMFAMLLFCSAMWGQSNVGRITGIVINTAGKVVPGAQVTATNAGTGATETTKSGPNGFYVFPSLPAGTYAVSATKPGFGTWIDHGIVLDAESTQTVNFRVAPGEGTHEAAGAQQVETTGGAVAGTIDSKKIDNVGMNGRNFQTLLGLLPGTSTATLDVFSLGLSASSYAVNGIRGASMMVAVDGISLLDPHTNRNVQAIPNAETISEMRVLASSFAAENPSLSGAYVNVITKSGTKSFHGNIFEYIRNDAFDAKSDLATIKQPLRFNDVGATLGGPVYIPGKFNANKSKLFFYVAEEWKFNHKGVTSVSTVPTADQRNGIFTTKVYQPGTYKSSTKTGTPYTTCPQDPTKIGYCVPSNLWSIYGAPTMDVYPVSNGTFNASNYSTTQVNAFDNLEDRYNLDYMPNAKTTVSARYTHNSNKTLNPFGNDPFGISPSNDQRPTSIGSVSVTHFFSPTTLNTASFAINAAHWTITPDVANVLLSKYGLPSPQIFAGDIFGGVLPTTTVTGMGTIGPGILSDRHTRMLQFADDFTKVMGKHVLKTGVVLLMPKSDSTPILGQASQGGVTYSLSNTQTTGNVVADALLGNFYSYTETATGGNYDAKYKQVELYAQDTFKVSKQLGIEYGVRWILPQQIYNPYDAATAFVPKYYSAAQAPTINLTNGSLVAGTGNPYNGLALGGSDWPTATRTAFPAYYGNLAYAGMFHGLPMGFTKAPMNDVAPRVGFAYDPFGTGKTAVRGGFGLFYQRPTMDALQSPSQNVPFNQTVTANNGNIANLANSSRIYPQTISTPETSTHKNPVVTSVNLGVQSEIAKGTVLGAGYVGTFGHHLPVTLDLNQYPVGTLTNAANVASGVVKNAPNSLRQYLGYGDIGLYSYSTNSNYHSLQSTLKHSSKNGVSYGASYTFSKTMETDSISKLPQNSYDPRNDYGLSDIHHASILSANGMYIIPFFQKGNPILTSILGHWGVSTVLAYQSGVALNPCLSIDNAGQGTASGLTSPALGGASACERATYTGNINDTPTAIGTLPAGRSAQQWFKTAVVTTPAQGTYGTGERNVLIGPYYFQEDMSMVKRFNIMKAAKAEIKADCFNLYNHDSYTTLGTTIGTSSFGSVTGTVPGRVFQLAMKVNY